MMEMVVKIGVIAKKIVALEVGFNKKWSGRAGGPRWRWGLEFILGFFFVWFSLFVLIYKNQMKEVTNEDFVSDSW